MSRYRLSSCLLLAVFGALPVPTSQAEGPLATAPQAPATAPAETPEVDSDDVFEMDLTVLMSMELSTGTLTKTHPRLVPAAITRIDKERIQYANPRSLTELLDIYVPNFQWSYHMWEPLHFGMRGIISDRDDKYLLLVNGRVMNERTHFGALTERDLVLLGDLRQVDVIRGPGSAVYGPGAISMVINQQTETGLTYQGTGAILKAGAYEEFYSAELKHGRQWDHDSGLFLYGGVAKYSGADSDYSPLIQGYDFDTSTGPVRHGDEDLPFNIIDLNRAYEDKPQVKLHAQLNSDGFTFWSRYTQGGSYATPSDRGPWVNWPVGWWEPRPIPLNGTGYQQLTGFAGYRGEIARALELDLSSSYDITEYERLNLGSISDSYREQKLISRALLHWYPAESHQVSGGVEYAHFRLGLPSWRSEELGGVISRFGGNTPTWTADMFSLIGEHQWRMSDQWTTIVSARADKHRFTDWMFSPRGAVAYSPTERDTYKLIASRSLRTNFEEEMKIEHDTLGRNSDPEVMQTLELRYERQQNESLFLAGSIFYNDLEVLGWDTSGAGGTKNLGAYETVGAEAELSYRTLHTDITLSHGYTKLVDFDLNPGVDTLISAAPYGYGYDLNNWSNHVTKLTVHRRLSRHWGANGSIRVLWDYEGDEDFLDYKNDNPMGGHPSSIEGWDEPYGPSVFLNLGAEYFINPKASFRLDAYNVLGWFDETLNKRDILGGVWEGVYRSEAAALAATLRYEF